MNNSKYDNDRTDSFKRNMALESFLKEINGDLWLAEKQLLSKHGEPEFPLIFVMGALRSGSTLLMQWLASLGCISYPTNFMSRMYNAPIIASKIQLLLTDEKYKFRNEMVEFNYSSNFTSKNGKTTGSLAPNEFWYFWRRFIQYDDLDYLSTSALLDSVDVDLLKSEFSGITNVFRKPFALKGQILNYNIDFLDKIFKKAIFIHIKRDPITNMESALEARLRQLGDVSKWYSFKIPEYVKLKEKSPEEQVAGQVYYINNMVSSSLQNVDEHKKITVNYEDFCENPQYLYDELRNKLLKNGFSIPSNYRGVSGFSISRKSSNNIVCKEAYMNIVKENSKNDY